MKVQHAQAELGHGRSPTVAELAEYLEVALEQVIEAMEAMATHSPVSLDAPLENGVDEPLTHHDLVGGLEEGYRLVDASIGLAAAVRELAEGDQRIVKLRFEDGLSQREIAGRIGVSQMQVSRILRRITDQLRQPMEIAPALVIAPSPTEANRPGESRRLDRSAPELEAELNEPCAPMLNIHHRPASG